MVDGWVLSGQVGEVLWKRLEEDGFGMVDLDYT